MISKFILPVNLTAAVILNIIITYECTYIENINLRVKKKWTSNFRGNYFKIIENLSSIQSKYTFKLIMDYLFK